MSNNKKITIAICMFAIGLFSIFFLNTLRDTKDPIVSIYPKSDSAPTGEPIIIEYSSNISNVDQITVQISPSTPVTYGVVLNYLVLFPRVELDNSRKYDIRVGGVILGDGQILNDLNYSFITRALTEEPQDNRVNKPTVPYQALSQTLTALPEKNDDFTISFYIKDGSTIVYRINLSASLNDASLYATQDPYGSYLKKLADQKEKAMSFLSDIGVNVNSASIEISPVEAAN